MNKKVFASLAVVGLLLAGSANAVPCGYFGVVPTSACQNGVTFNDSQAVLNDNSYFGINTWQLLDVVEPGDLSNQDYWSVRGAASRQVSGTATLKPLIWNTYKILAMVLKDGGAVGGGQTVNWSLYELIPNTNFYTWIYGVDATGHFRSVYHVSLYGSIYPRVSEPSSIVLMLLGLTGIALAYRRRRGLRI